MAVIKLTIHAFLADIEAVKADDMSLVTGTDSAQVGSYLISVSTRQKGRNGRLSRGPIS